MTLPIWEVKLKYRNNSCVKFNCQSFFVGLTFYQKYSSGSNANDYWTRMRISMEGWFNFLTYVLLIYCLEVDKINWKFRQLSIWCVVVSFTRPFCHLQNFILKGRYHNQEMSLSGCLETSWCVVSISLWNKKLFYSMTP